MKELTKHLTFANVVACLALFVALGGVGYANLKLPKNSVGTKQLKNNAVTAAKIKNGAVSGSKVDISSLGTVPSATHAASATSANTAGSATNAQTLQGLTPAQIAAAAKVSCPGGMTLVAGTCFEKSQRASVQYLTAYETCAKAGLLLPSTAQVKAFQEATGSSVPEWAGQAYYTGSGPFHAQVLGTESTDTSIFATFGFRCSIPALN